MGYSVTQAAITAIIVVIVIIMFAVGIKSTFCSRTSFLKCRGLSNCRLTCEQDDEEEEEEDDEPDDGGDQVDPNMYQLPPDYAECVNNPRYPKPTEQQKQIYTINGDVTGHNQSSPSGRGVTTRPVRRSGGARSEVKLREVSGGLDIEGLPSYSCVEKGDFVLLTEPTWQEIRRLQEQMLADVAQRGDGGAEGTRADMEVNSSEADQPSGPPESLELALVHRAMASSEASVTSGADPDGGYINRSFVVDPEDPTCDVTGNPVAANESVIVNETISPHTHTRKPKSQRKQKHHQHHTDHQMNGMNPQSHESENNNEMNITAHAHCRHNLGNQVMARAHSLPQLVFDPEMSEAVQDRDRGRRGSLSEGVSASGYIQRKDFELSLSDPHSGPHCISADCGQTQTDSSSRHTRPQLTLRTNSVGSAV